MREGWTYKKLGDICESDLGKTLNQSKDVGDMCPYLCAVNIQWDHVDIDTLKTARFSDIDKQKYSVKKGDLLVCEGGDIGRAAIWDKDGTMQYQNALHRIRFIDNTFCPRFYLAYLRYLKNKGILDSRYGKGVTIQHLVKSSLLSIPVPVPLLPEQERIVAELDLLTGIIDKQKAQLQELDTLAQSIFYDMFGDPVENDKEWTLKKLCEIGEIIAGSTPSTSDESNWDGDVNWVTPAELGIQLYYGETERKITNKAAKSLTLMPVGTVLLSSRAPIGKLAITSVPMCCNQGFKNIICGEEMNNVFLYYFLMLTMENIKALGRGATFKEVSKQAISSYKVIVPPLSLQQSFAQKIQSIESQKASINQSIAETQKLFDSAMDKYFG